MTFTAKVKDEIASSSLNEVENRNLFLGYLYTAGDISKGLVTLSLENKEVAEKLWKTLKYCYHTDAKITIRTQKKFHLKRIFILEVEDKKRLFESELSTLDLDDREALTSFIKGVFLATGSINDPEKSRYHLELVFQNKNKGSFILEILNSLDYGFKMIKRNHTYMLYLKSSEEISDFLKLLGAVNSLFHFEDIRIYRDHTNMVNRLNNCEQANLEKTLATCDKQLEKIKYIKDNDYMSLLDEKTAQVAEYRLRYPEESFQGLSDILSSETGKKVSKSYVNHHFRKIAEIYDNILKSIER